MIAARVGDYSPRAFFVAQRRNLVVGAAQFECADGLKIFRLEIENVAVIFEGD